MTNSTIDLSTGIRRCVISIAIAIGLLALIVVFRPKSQVGVPEAKFWLNKFDANRYNVVLAGDSRVLHGLSPQPFSDLGVGSATNFGFQGVALNKRYFDVAVSRLSQDGPRVLVLGITPNSFTPSANSSNGFTKYIEIADAEVFEMPEWFYRMQDQLRPASLAEMLRIARRRSGSMSTTLHPDGWSAVNTKFPDDTSALKFYRVRFDKNEVEHKHMEESFEMVSSCVEAGINVFGVQVPVTEAMQEIENSKSGFNYDAYIARFEEAGGVWLRPDITDCKTHDGSHLDSQSATLYSTRLATLVKDRIAESP